MRQLSSCFHAFPSLHLAHQKGSVHCAMLPAHELSLPVTMKVRERGGKEEGGREGGRKGEKERERERERGKKGGKEGKSGRGRKVGAVTSMFMTKDDTGTWMSGK